MSQTRNDGNDGKIRIMIGSIETNLRLVLSYQFPENKKKFDTPWPVPTTHEQYHIVHHYFDVINEIRDEIVMPSHLGSIYNEIFRCFAQHHVVETYFAFRFSKELPSIENSILNEKIKNFIEPEFYNYCLGLNYFIIGRRLCEDKTQRELTISYLQKARNLLSEVVEQKCVLSRYFDIPDILAFCTKNITV